MLFGNFGFKSALCRADITGIIHKVRPSCQRAIDRETGIGRSHETCFLLRGIDIRRYCDVMSGVRCASARSGNCPAYRSVDEKLPSLTEIARFAWRGQCRTLSGRNDDRRLGNRKALAAA